MGKLSKLFSPLTFLDILANRKMFLSSMRSASDINLKATSHMTQEKKTKKLEILYPYNREENKH